MGGDDIEFPQQYLFATAGNGLLWKAISENCAKLFTLDVSAWHHYMCMWASSFASTSPACTDCLQCWGQVLGDLVEALTGAIFLDTGQDLDATWQVRGTVTQARCSHASQMQSSAFHACHL